MYLLLLPWREEDDDLWIAVDAMLVRDIRWPGYIKVLLDTYIRLIHLCHLIDLELLRTSLLLLFKLDP